MALSKQIIVDSATINYNEYGRIEVIKHTVVNEDDDFLVGKKDKHYFYPGKISGGGVYGHTDVSDEHPSVQKLAELWDNDIHAAYAERIGADIV